MPERGDVDAVVVGASIAGCTAATLLARAGARVALVERRPDPAAFKRVCGHFIQPSAVPVLERLGVLDGCLAAGAVCGHVRLRMPWGWIGDPAARASAGKRPSVNLRREALDPLLRGTAAEQPGVDLLLGHAVEGVRFVDGRPAGVLLRSPAGERVVRARLVVGADGRGSSTAALAGARTWRTPNVRFAYWGYFAGPGLAPGTSAQAWFAMPDVAIAVGTDSGLTIYAVFPERRRIAEFKAAPEQALRACFAAMPEPPLLAESHRVGPMVGKLDLTNEYRGPAPRGVGLVGDAALVADPLNAIGCGWALQSAQWLADALAPALAGERTVGEGLRIYARRHRRELGAHAVISSLGSRLRRFTPLESLLFSAAVHDNDLARRVEAFAAREIQPAAVVNPRSIARALAVRARA